MGLTPADIDRWDPEAVRDVFHSARARAAAVSEASEALAGLAVFQTWDGSAAQAAQSAIGKTRVDLDAHGNEALAVARAADKAADDIDSLRRRLAAIRDEAGRLGMLVDAATGRVMPGPNVVNPMEAFIKTEQLQPKVDALLADAATVDGELAAAINMADGQTPIPGGAPGAAPITKQDTAIDPTGQSILGDLNGANDKSVLAAMERVKAAQRAVDDAAATVYTKGPGSPEAEAALARMPTLRKNLADALDDLGKIPDYSRIDPNTVRVDPNGNVLFSYSTGGQLMQVTGTLKNGTGELFDQGTKAYYTYRDGVLVGTRFLDEGRAIATDEPLLTAVTTAVGAGPLIKGGQAGYLGLRALLSEEAIAGGTSLTSDQVLPHALEQAAARTASASEHLAALGPGAWAPVTESMSARAAAYQMQITGHPITEGYLVNGVKFDGFENGVLTDTKGFYNQFIEGGEWKPWFSGDQSMISQAQRQLAAAHGTPIQWVFAEPDSAAVVGRMLAENDISGIRILVVPPK